MKLLVCISFHFSKEKLSYLKQVLKNHIENYNCDVIIDTNSKDINQQISEFELEIKLKKIEIFIHEKLSHPFFLTWTHRDHFIKKINEYEVFMYVEDDILVPYENYINYLKNFDLLWPNYIPSFIRIEEKEGIFYNADCFYRTIAREKNIVKIENKKFIELDNPYHGFWIMPREPLKQSINEHFACVTEEKTWIREIAASYGLKPSKKRYAKWKSKDIQKPGLVELSEDYKVSNLCYSYHLTNKYINDQRFNFGKIKVDKIIKQEAKLL